MYEYVTSVQYSKFVWSENTVMCRNIVLNNGKYWIYLSFTLKNKLIMPFSSNKYCTAGNWILLGTLDTILLQYASGKKGCSICTTVHPCQVGKVRSCEGRRRSKSDCRPKPPKFRSQRCPVYRREEKEKSDKKVAFTSNKGTDEHTVFMGKNPIQQPSSDFDLSLSRK